MTAMPVEVSGVETTGGYAERPEVGLWELARTFLVIGATGFGGGMAVVALIQQMLVEKRRWLSTDEFAHGVTLSQFLGAFAVNTTCFVGYQMKGVRGAVVAVTAFLTPGVTMIIVLSALYFRYQHVPALQNALSGIGPVVVAVLALAAYRMGRGAMGGLEPIALALTAFLLLAFLSAPVFLIIAGLGLYGLGRHALSRWEMPA